MGKYQNYITFSNKYNQKHDNLNENENEDCCFVIGFTSLILSVSFFLGYLAYNYS